MNFFDTLQKRIDEAQSNKKNSLKLQGLDANLYGLFLSFQKVWEQHRNNIFIFPAQDQAEEFFDLCKNNHFDAECLLLAGHDHGPYGGYISSERNLFERFFALQNCLRAQKEGKPVLLFTTMEALHLKNPPRSLIEEQQLKIELSDIISPDQLKSKLVARGYQHSFTIEEPGTFSHKGEIFDLYPADGEPVRLHYFDDMVEEIFPIDRESLKSLRDQPLESISIGISPRLFCRGDFSTNLRASIPMPPVSHRPKFERRKKVFESLSNGFLFENYPTYIPLFCKSTESCLDFLDLSKTQVHLFNSFRTLEEWSGFLDEIKEDFELVSNDIDNDCILPSPDNFYESDLLKNIGTEKIIEINEVEINLNLEENFTSLKMN
jgi:transcription-repair coupling factor (superfamily II helicase)